MKKSLADLKLLVVCCVLGGVSGLCFAANPASDSASDPVYSSGWTNGQNGGYGFGPWTLISYGANNGHFIGSSTNNADGLDDGLSNGSPADGDIDTAGASWGMHALDYALAWRSFTGSALQPTEKFSIDWDHGFLQPSAKVGVGLAVGSSIVLEVFALGTSSQYFYADAGGTNALSLNLGDEGLTLIVTMIAPTAYKAELLRRDGSSETWSGFVSGAPDGFVAFDYNGGGGTPGTPFDFFINQVSVVPEPASLMLLLTGVFLFPICALKRRCRRP